MRLDRDGRVCYGECRSMKSRHESNLLLREKTATVGDWYTECSASIAWLHEEEDLEEESRRKKENNPSFFPTLSGLLMHLVSLEP